MKRAALYLLISIFALAARSQNNSLGKNDPDAKKVLDRVTEKFKTYKTIQADFVLKVDDSGNKPVGSKKGTLYLKGNAYHVSVTGQEIFCDGKDVWTYDKSANEVTVTKYESSAKTISPEKLFTNFYEKDFLYKLNGDVKQGGKTLQEIELTPVDKTKTFFKAYLYVDKKSQTINSLKWLEKSGNKYTLVANKLNGNAHIADNQFAFDKSKFPGVEEVDLRN